MDKDQATHKYLRFAFPERIEHWLLFLSFSTLAVTGLVQKFHDVGISIWFVELCGGIENVRIIHRIAATAMMLETVYHLGAAGYKVLVKRVRMSMLPGLDDARAALGWLLYNVGLSKERPLEGRYTFGEKAEYWALVWGTIVMGITGFMLWNPIATVKILPGEFIPAAKAAHGAEAVLAVLAIIVWHVYGVHIKMFNKSMFHGHLSDEEMAHEHPLELAEMKAETAERVLDPAKMQRRRQVYVVVYAVAAILMIAAIYFFVTFEETALLTVAPIEEVEAYAPLTPTPLPTPLPTPTPAPVEAELTWDTVVSGRFQQQCAACHSSATALGGLDLSSYQTIVTGGASGPGVIPGDPDGSSVIARQVTGDHPGQFSGDDLALLRKWIEAGAPEN